MGYRALFTVMLVALAAGQAAAGAAAPQPGVAPGTLAVRMSESMAWPERFSATVRVEAAGGAPEDAVAFRLTGFPPDTFRWEPLDRRGLGGTAWRGYLRLDVEGPGPRFSYGTDGFPFLKALEAYFSVFRPLPQGSRLVLGQGVRILNRPAVEATLFDADAARQVRLAIDLETGLVLRASIPPGSDGAGQETALVRAVRFDTGAALATVEYEAPVLGQRGRLVLVRRNQAWFLGEAVVGDQTRAHRVRFDDVRLGEAAASAQAPDVGELQKLASAIEQARQHARAKRWPEAIRAARAVVAIDPYNLDAHNLWGYAAMELGDWVTAASEFDQVIHLAPDSPLGYNNLAYLYTEMGSSLSRALSLASRAMELSGDEPDASVLDTYGWALFHNGRLDEARAMLERAVAASGDDPESQAEILYHLGVVHARMQRYDEARRLFARALELDPALAQAREAMRALPAGEGEPQAQGGGG